MRICVFGAGAIGGHLAAHIARTGAEVSVVARGPHLAAIRQKGLRVVSAAEDFTVRVPATDDPATLGEQDYVFITLKAHQVPGALPAIQPLLGPDTAVIPPTTGIPWWYFYALDGEHSGRQVAALDPGGLQWGALGPERALGCVFWVGSEVVEPGVIRADGGTGYPLGEPDGSASERVTALSAVLTAGGLKAPVRADIRGDIWIKMLNSLAFNPVAALGGATLADLAGLPAAVDVVRRMMAEGEAVAARLGVRIPVPMEKRITSTLAIGGHKMSMLQDLERGRPVELDTLEISMRAMAGIAGIETPTIDTVLTLMRLRAKVAGLA